MILHYLTSPWWECICVLLAVSHSVLSYSGPYLATSLLNGLAYHVSISQGFAHVQFHRRRLLSGDMDLVRPVTF